MVVDRNMEFRTLPFARCSVSARWITAYTIDRALSDDIGVVMGLKDKGC